MSTITMSPIMMTQHFFLLAFSILILAMFICFSACSMHQLASFTSSSIVWILSPCYLTRTPITCSRSRHYLMEFQSERISLVFWMMSLRAFWTRRDLPQSCCHLSCWACLWFFLFYMSWFISRSMFISCCTKWTSQFLK